MKIITKEKIYNKVKIKVFDITVISYYVNSKGKILLKNMLNNGLASFLAIFIANKIQRKKFRRNFASTIIINPKIKRRKEPVKPYAFVRVMNEIETIDTCLKSILPVIDRGVISFNDCNDGTEEYVMEFCRLHTGFIPYKYPHTLYDLRDPRNMEKGNEENKFHTYCNKALKLIPQNEWILKIDVDQTYEADMLKDMFYLPKDENDTVIFGILNLHYDGKELYFFKPCPYLINPDHWLIFNNNLESSLNITSKNPFCSEEHFDISGNHLVFTETNSYHFPFIKKRRNNIDYKYLVEFNEFVESGNLEKFIKEKGLPYYINPEILNKERILSFCKDFNLESKRILPK